MYADEKSKAYFLLNNFLNTPPFLELEQLCLKSSMIFACSFSRACKRFNNNFNSSVHASFSLLTLRENLIKIQNTLKMHYSKTLGKSL